MTPNQQDAISSSPQDPRQQSNHCVTAIDPVRDAELMRRLHEGAARLARNGDFFYIGLPGEPDGENSGSWIFDPKGDGEIRRRFHRVCYEVCRDGRVLETPPPGSEPSTGKRPEAESWVQLVTNACKNSGDTPVIIIAPARIEKSILSSIEPVESRE